MDTNGLFTECTTALLGCFHMFPSLRRMSFCTSAIAGSTLHVWVTWSSSPLRGGESTIDPWERGDGFKMISLENNHGRGISFLVNKLVKMAGNCQVQVQGKSHFFWGQATFWRSFDEVPVYFPHRQAGIQPKTTSSQAAWWCRENSCCYTDVFHEKWWGVGWLIMVNCKLNLGDVFRKVVFWISERRGMFGFCPKKWWLPSKIPPPCEQILPIRTMRAWGTAHDERFAVEPGFGLGVVETWY